MTLAYWYGACIFVRYLHICTVFAHGKYGRHTLANAMVLYPCVTVPTVQVQDEFMAPLYHKCVPVDVVDERSTFHVHCIVVLARTGAR